jgi:hypothetical protein
MRPYMYVRKSSAAIDLCSALYIAAISPRFKVIAATARLRRSVIEGEVAILFINIQAGVFTEQEKHIYTSPVVLYDMGRPHMRNFILAIALALLVVACTGAPTGAAINSTNDTQSTDTATDVRVPETPAPVEESLPSDARFTINGTEGDLIQLKPQAIDPDGDALSYTFAEPFDSNGDWQTVVGDEGTYDVAVGVSDSKSTTTETVRVIVLRANRAPIIVCRELVVSEGEIVDLHQSCTVSDEDDEDVVVTYTGWMNSWRYTTTYDDEGRHAVTVTASDPTHTVTQNVSVVVQNTNRPPVFSADFPAVINAVENDIVTIPTLHITDPDKDSVTITYSAPFDDDGVWRTKIGDAGTYDIDVVASDGETTVKKTITVQIGLLNTVPVLREIPDITVKEGETIKLPISATDREGDGLTTTISGFMTRDTYKTTYDDAGVYTVRVAVTDGEFTAEQIVKITIIDVNRPPVFVTPA